jgi:hypothetical protein
MTGFKVYESYDSSICELCGVQFEHKIPQAEAYDPESDEGGYICHAACARAKGLTIEWERMR